MPESKSSPEAPDPQASLPKVVAAVDLGSNSFHMKVAQVVDGHIHVVDRLKEMVRLAAGLDEKKRLEREAMDRAMQCLERFGQRLRDVPAEGVRVVGTNTLRRARNSRAFLKRGAQALGHRIEVISGIEEARLIYSGVSHSVPQDHAQRLVVDIGGGSTEVIVGHGFEPVRLESLYMGCVGFSRAYFPDGAITEAKLREAELAALQELEPIEVRFRRLGWDKVFGSSGTIINVHEVIQANGWSDRGITAEAIARVRSALVEAGHAEKLALKGLQPERASVFAGGVAILSAVFGSLGIDRMERADGALREGLLYDLLGRLGPEDVRETTVQDLIAKYRIDAEQASQVARTALELRNQVGPAWRLRKTKYADALRWAAHLHELGLAIAHSQYHKHGAYLISHADLPGFSLEEQMLIAGLVRAHRRTFPMRLLAGLAVPKSRAIRLAVLLRVAAVLHRARSELRPEVGARANGQTLSLRFPDGWLAAHPLTRVDLEQEAQYLKAGRIDLEFS